VVDRPLDATDPLRQTGRTTRMLRESIGAGFALGLSSGLPVLIVCASDHETECILNMFCDLVESIYGELSIHRNARRRVTISYFGESVEYRFSTPEWDRPSRGDFAEVYIDHHAREIHGFGEERRGKR